MLLPRYLTAEALGQYTIVVTIGTLAGTVAALGVPDFLVRRVATRRDRAVTETGAAFIFLLLVSLALGAVLLAVVPFINPLASGKALLVIAVVGMVVAGVQAPILALLRGHEHHGRFAWLNVAASVMATVVGVPVLLLGGDVVAYALAGVAAGVLVTVVTIRASGFRLHRSQIDLHVWRQLARGGAAFLGMNVTLVIRGQIDRLLLAALTSAPTVGWYAAAGRVAGIPVFIPTLIVTPLLPALSRCGDDKPAFLRTLRRSLDIVLMLTLPAAAMLIAVAPDVPRLLGWSAEFSHSVPLIMLLACQVVVVALNMVLGTALIALHQERPWLRVLVLAALFNLGLNVAAIPYFQMTMQNGAIGAAVTTVGTELVIFGGALLVLPRGTLDSATTLRGAKLACAAVVLLLVARAIMPLSLPLAVLMAGAIWAGVTLAVGVLRLADVRSAHQLALAALSRRTAKSAA